MRRFARHWTVGRRAFALLLLASLVPAAAQAAENVLPNGTFEGTGSGSLAGWKAAGSTLSLANDGHGGGHAALVTATAATSGLKSAKIAAGAGDYVADAFVRSGAAGKTLCLKLSEFTTAGALVGATQKCATSTAAWTALPQVARTVGVGTLSVMIFEKRAAAGSTFEVDDVSLLAQGAGGGGVPAPPTGLTATAPNSTTVELTWNASAGATAYKVYRVPQTVAIATVSGTSFTHTGRSPNTTYTYQVSALNAAGESAKTAQVSITTPSGGGTGGVRIGAAGDIACDPASSNFNGGLGRNGFCQMRATSDLLVGRSLDAVLPLGDNQYECGGLTAFQQSYDPSWGRVNGITRPVPGDNDYDNRTTQPGGTGCSANHDAAGYYSYFGAAAGNPARGYYSYNLGSWHLVALNSNCGFVPCAAGSAQERFLRNDLAASGAACTLVYFHHPRFSSGGSATNLVAPFWNAMYAAGVDIVLNGHSHVYERFAPQTPQGAANANGVRQFTVGTGGKSLGRLKTAAANSQAFVTSSYGVLELSLGNGSYSWDFRRVGGGSGDAGTGTCH
jgi:acid phosphatase type 7